MSDKQLTKEKWLLASTLLNLLMAAGKLTVGILTNTGVIIADGIHSLSDVVNSILIYASIKLAGKKTKRFPFGMHKLEDFAALIGGIVIIYAGFEIVRSVILSKGELTINHPYLTVGFLIVVLFFQAGFAFFEFKSSKKLNSPGVQTDLLDWIMDIGATIVAISGIVLSYNKIPYAQEVAVVIIVLMIFHGAYEILKDAALTLLDASVDVSIIEKAKSIISSYPEVGKIETLFIRKAGSIFIADIVLQINLKNMDTAHDIVEKIEQNLKREIEHLEIVTIHYEPVKKKYKKVATFLTKNGEIAQRLRDVAVVQIDEADEKGNVFNSFRYENPYFERGRGHSIKLIAWLVKQNVDVIIFHPLEMDSEKLELFENLGIKIEK